MSKYSIIVNLSVVDKFATYGRIRGCSTLKMRIYITVVEKFVYKYVMILSVYKGKS